MFARLSGFDSAKQGRQEVRKAGSRQDNTQDVPSTPPSKGGKKPGKQEAPKTTRKTCHRRRVTCLTTDDNG